MKAIFIETEGEYLEASFELNGVKMYAMDEFAGNQCKPGDEIDIEITAGLVDESEAWESIFSGNPEKKKAVEHIKGWSYRVFGEITNISPDVVVDAGVALLEAPIDTHDERVVGEYIAFTIMRLDAYAS